MGIRRVAGLTRNRFWMRVKVGIIESARSLR